MKRSMKHSIALCALLPVVAMGVDTWWNGHTVGNWEDAGNWNAGVPITSSRAIINQPDDQVTINTTNAVANDMILKGSLTIASAAKLTIGALNTTTAEVAPTEIVVNGQLTHVGSSWFQLGGAGVATSAMTINSGGSVISTNGNEFVLGQKGPANLIVNGRFARTGWMHVGANSTASITVNDGGIFYTEVVYTAPGSTVDITINGGAANIPALEWDNGGAGTLNMNGGKLDVTLFLDTPQNTYNISGGEIVFWETDLATVEGIVAGSNWHFAENPSVVDLGDGRISVTSISSLPPTIISLSAVSSSTVKMVVDTIGLKESYYPVASSNLTGGAWGNIPHSDDGVNPFVVTNLSYSTADASGTNEVIYLQVNHAQKFFKVDGN